MKKLHSFTPVRHSFPERNELKNELSKIGFPSFFDNSSSDNSSNGLDSLFSFVSSKDSKFCYKNQKMGIQYEYSTLRTKIPSRPDSRFHDFKNLLH